MIIKRIPKKALKLKKEPIIEILPTEEESIKEDVFSEEINFNIEEENEEIL